MPVLDIAANQIHAQPVTAYYQGKALRLAEQMNQQKMRMAEEELSLAKNADRRAQEELDLKKGPQKPDQATITAVRKQIEPLALSDMSDEQFLQSASLIGQQYDLPGLAPDVAMQLRQSFVKEEPKRKGFGTNIESGINPKTNKPDTYIVDKDSGEPKWLNIPPAPSGDDGTERERVSAELEAFESRIKGGAPLSPEDKVKHQLAWLRAEALGVDPARTGLSNPGVSEKKKDLTPLQRTEAISAVRQLDHSAELIDKALGIAQGPDRHWAVGAPAMAKRLHETVMGFMNDKASQPAKEFARALNLLKATNWKAMLGSGQISTADYIFLDSIFVGEGFGDDPVATANGLIQVRDWMAFKRDDKAASVGMAPTQALQYLKDHPETQEQFDEAYPNG